MDAFEIFKLEILSNAAFEDWQGVWEPLWWLHGGGRIAGQTAGEREQFTEHALRADWWRGEHGMSRDVETVVWFAATPAGAATCGAPSPDSD